MRWLLYKTHGGLTDILNQIWVCREYARRSSRRLIVDSVNVGGYSADIRTLLTIPDVWDGDLDEFYRERERRRETVFPPQATDVKAYAPRFVDPWSRLPMDRDFPEMDILVHGAGGGGPHLVDLLALSCATPLVRATFAARRAALPTTGYLSIHVRNTDYGSDVLGFINDHVIEWEGRDLFVASDDARAIELFQQCFGPRRVFTFSRIPPTHPGQPLHLGVLSGRDVLLDALVDMLLLATGTAFYGSCAKSGFTRSARALFDRRDVVDRLVGVC